MKFEAGEVEEKVVAVSALVLVVGFLVEVFAAVVNIDVIKVMGLIPIVVVEMVGFVVLLFIVVVFGGAVLAVVVPRGHEEQFFSPRTAVYIPTPHVSHTPPESLASLCNAYPLGHSVQEDCATSAPGYWPAAHATQAAADNCPEAAEYLPNSHWVHCVPATSVYQPSGHGW